MSRIASTFSQIKHKALIPYMTVGYPSIKATVETASVLAARGCDVIELGIPFSDPLADGATIQKASYQALQNGVTPEVCLEVASQIRKKVNTPLVFMTYYNPVFRFGLEAFCKASAEAGIDGLIIPDLPPEEGIELEACAQKQGLDVIYLLAPTSSDERIDLVAMRSRGFIYLVSLAGVTGARAVLADNLEEFVSRVREKTSLPLCVGFGISTPEQAKRVAQIADGVIVGSRVVQLMEEGSIAGLEKFIGGLRKAIGS